MSLFYVKTPPEIGRVNKSLDGRVQKYDTKRTKILNVLTDLFTRTNSTSDFRARNKQVHYRVQKYNVSLVKLQA